MRRGRVLLPAFEQHGLAMAHVISTFAVGGMLVLAMLTVVDISLRYFFSTPIRGLDEASGLLMAGIVAATFPSGIMARNHITVDLLTDLLSKRVAKIGEAIGAVMLLVMLVILTWRMGIYANRLMLRANETVIVGIPTAPFWWGATALFALCVPLQLVVTTRIGTELVEAFSRKRGAPSVTHREALTGALIIGGSAALTAILYVIIAVWGAGMSATSLALIAFAAVWVPLMMLVPVGAAMGLAGLLATAVLTNYEVSFSTFAIQAASFLGNSNVSVLPLFLMMGSFAAAAGLSDDVYALAHALLGRWRGGLAMATIGGCAGFGAVTGSSVATVAMLGRVSIPAMKARGYSPALTTGTIAAGGTLGPLVPPGSGPLVIFALLTQASIGQLMIASVGPAALAVLLYLITIMIYVRIWPESAPGRSVAQPGELRAALRRSGPVTVLFGGVLGGLYLGLFTGTESAAVGAAAAFFIALWRGKVRRETFLAVIGETTLTTAMIYIIILGALIFSYFTGLSGVAEDITKLIIGLNWSPTAVVFLLLAIYIALGTFMESYTIMLISVPIVTPLIVGMEYSILWWGILMLCVVETGAITPPFGLNMFVAKNLADVPMSAVFRGVTPFVIADIVRITIIALFPPLSLWLVSTMFS